MLLRFSFDSAKRLPRVPLYHSFPCLPSIFGDTSVFANAVLPQPSSPNSPGAWPGWGGGGVVLPSVSSQQSASPTSHLSWEGAIAESGYSLHSLPSPRQDQMSHTRLSDQPHSSVVSVQRLLFPHGPPHTPEEAQGVGGGGAGLQDPAWSPGGVSHCSCFPIFLPRSSFPLPQPPHSENLVSLTRSAWGDQDQTPD